MMRTSMTVAGLLTIATLALGQPGGPALPPAKSARPGQTPDPARSRESSVPLEQVKPLTNVERSELRERALAILQEFARSDSALLRANAIEGLQPAPSRCEPLVRAGLTDENLGVRYVAAMTVGRAKLKGSLPMVRPLLRDADASVRAAAIFALARCGERVEQTELGSTLMNGDLRSRSNVAFILGEMGNKSAAPMLRDAARQPLNGENPIAVKLFRLQLAESLVKLGDSTACDMIDAALYPAAQGDFEAAVLAAQIIGEAKIEKAAGQLINLIEMMPAGAAKPADPRKAVFLQPKELRMAAAASMGKLGYYGGWYVGDMYAEDQDDVVRGQAAFTLGATAHKETVNPSIVRLKKMLDDKSSMVRCSAAASLLKLMEGN